MDRLARDIWQVSLVVVMFELTGGLEYAPPSSCIELNSIALNTVVL